MASPKKILVVEDEPDVRGLVLLQLGRNGYSPYAVEDGEASLKILENETFDLVVLDWMLPGLTGLEICRRLRAHPKTSVASIPILMATARADSTDVVEGLNAGADDYVTKPFDLPIFLARVDALLRRTERGVADFGLLRSGALTLDIKSHEVRCEDQELQLTSSEFKLLEALMSHSGSVFSREKLIERIQGEGVSVVDRSIDTHVFGLRKKLGKCASAIETIRGVGYRVKAGPAS